MPGQSSEEAAELVATIRGEHVVMKNWFMGPTQEAKELRDKYGPYPGLWKEVLNWPGWKEARKAYLKFTQGGGNESMSKSPHDGDQAPRKRRSRWGVANDDEDHHNEHEGDPPSQRPRRSRWGQESGPPVPAPAPVVPPPQLPVPAIPSQSTTGALPVPIVPLPGLGLPGMPQNLSPQQQDEFRRHQARLKEINSKLDNLDAEAARVDALPRGHRDRSPSPPPVYGTDGKRKNTRAVRWRQRYTAERQDILEKLMNLNPATRQSGLFKRKRTKKIRIPIEQHPQYNFIGLIIGPRGKTQKELESKTGCKIAIRGRGSVKEGARGRRDGKVMESDDEPLHVVITGDDQRSVDAATDMIEQMLVVIDDEKNVHKQQQLRELALLNGTLKEEEFCSICAEKGHRAFECPRKFSMKKNTVQVRCAICGDTSHPTRDCTQKPIEQGNQKEMDSDYMSFMAELDGKKVEQAAPAIPPAAPPNGGPPKPPSDLPPPPPILTPVPAGGVNLPPPPTAPPPPPTRLPPPQPTASAPGNYYGAPHHYGNHHQYQAPPPDQAATQPPVPGYYGNQPPVAAVPAATNAQDTTQQWQQYYQQQQQQGWDYQSYYGQGGRGGDAGGSVGFNWWENS